MAPAEHAEEGADIHLAREHGWLVRKRIGGEKLMAHVLAVVVLYRLEPARSKTLVGLARAVEEDPTLAKQIEILVWDNSPAAIDERSIPFPCTYRHTAANEGVSGAYNAAAAMAVERGCAWILLLDHDTSITKEFLRGMLAHAAQSDRNEQVAAVVPFLYANNFCLSPRLWRFGRHVPLTRPAIAYTEGREIFSANSGTLMRVRALSSIGGYSKRFWLDYSDIDVFHRLHERGFSIRIAHDLALQHEVALLDYNTRMTPARYAIYLAAESDFLDLYRGVAERLLHLIRLAARTIRQRRLADRTFSKMTRQELWRRLYSRRQARLRPHDPLSREAS
jgi:GT2 family glycosyltransferase